MEIKGAIGIGVGGECETELVNARIRLLFNVAVKSSALTTRKTISTKVFGLYAWHITIGKVLNELAAGDLELTGGSVITQNGVARRKRGHRLQVLVEVRCFLVRRYER